MKSNKYILAGFSILISFALTAQSNFGSIKGKVFNDDGNLEPFAEIWVDLGGDNNLKTESDLDGRFTIKPLDAGTYTVFATTFACDTSVISGVVINPGEITFVNDLRVSPKVVKTEHNIVLIDIEDPTAMVIGSEELQGNPNIRNPAQMLSGLSPEIKTNENGEIFFRGSRSGSSVYYIDGVKLTGGLANLPARAYGSVKVYTGGMPAQYGDATGGVVAIETISYFDQWRRKKASMNK